MSQLSWHEEQKAQAYRDAIDAEGEAFGLAQYRQREQRSAVGKKYINRSNVKHEIRTRQRDPLKVDDASPLRISNS